MSEFKSAMWPTPSMCLASEWQRDGRGLWAMRACQYYEQHGKAHWFGAWRYNVEPPSSGARPTDLEAGKASGSATESDLRTETEEREGLRAERDHLGVNLEMVRAELRGHRDFFTGQPKDMPFTEPGQYAKNSQLNFAWTLGYETAEESPLYTLMVGRADRSAERSQKAADQLAALTEGHERLIEGVKAYINGILSTRGLNALLSPREGTQLQEDQELTDDLARRDTQTSTEGQPAASTDTKG